MPMSSRLGGPGHPDIGGGLAQGQLAHGCSCHSSSGVFFALVSPGEEARVPEGWRHPLS